MLELERLDCNIGPEVISFRHSILLLSVTFNIKIARSCHTMKTLDQPETGLDRSVEEIVVGVGTDGSTGEISVLTVVEIYHPPSL